MNNPIYGDARRDVRTRQYLSVRRIVLQSTDKNAPENAEFFLDNHEIQTELQLPRCCKLPPGGWLVLDFGTELNGGIRIVTGVNDARIRRMKVNFGESVSEAMQTPNQDHAIHETEIDLAPMGSTEIGNTGFRFVRLTAPAYGAPIELLNVVAVAIYRDLDYVGNFRCSDDRLNQIWQTGAYTVHLNMQDYIYDGIKRDRLVWMGDMNPEIRVICSVFNDCDCVEKSLDFVRTHTPLPAMINGISAYSLWWIISQYDWYRYRGRREYLQEQQTYLAALLRQLSEYVDADGTEKLPEWRFLDWPTNGHPEAIHAGLQGLLNWGMIAGEKLARSLNDSDTAKLCAETSGKLRRQNPDGGNSKPAAAMKALGGIADARQLNREVLANEPLTGVSTFFGYYMMEARALAGDLAGAVDTIRQYWGGMLDVGATTFWEDFDLAWLKRAGRIDEVPTPDKVDIHAAYGNFCYTGLRHSFCHGWAGGPTAWLSNHLLGVRPVEPGFKVADVKPQLPGLDWLEGAMPTPFGPIRVTAEKRKDGEVDFKVEKPPEVTLQ